MAIIGDELLVFGKLENLNFFVSLLYLRLSEGKVAHLPLLVLDGSATLSYKLFQLCLPVVCHLEESVLVCGADL